MSQPNWATLLTRPPITPSGMVIEAVRRFPSASEPVLVRASNGLNYVVKGMRPRGDRTPTTEQVVAALGQRLHAPIPPTPLLVLTPELQAASPELSHFTPGLLHASQYDEDCGERKSFDYHHDGPNRGHFAALAVLYTWMGASDHQFLYRPSLANEVISVDHGHFFGGSGTWDATALAAIAAVTALDKEFSIIGLQPAELASAFDRLAALTDEDVAAAVARPPDSWGTTIDERIALCAYLYERRQQVLGLRSVP